MNEPLIEDDEFWQGVVDAADCILPGRVIEAICTALDRRAAPDEASRAPAPQEQPAKGDDTLGALIDLHGQVSHFCETEGEADFETSRATRAINAAKAARAPAPISEETINELWKVAGAQWVAQDDCAPWQHEIFAKMLLAQSQGGQPAGEPRGETKP